MERAEGWARVARTSGFQELMRKKKAFLIPAVIFFMVFYFTLPVLTAYTTVLNFEVIEGLSLAYIYAFAQFVMTWTLCHIYLSQANKWDDLVEKARHEAAEDTAEEGSA
ncbi:MAG: DUF485 domain-containing protein [Rubrobacter sp.]|jgi:uncharacterized membrane protein (DUF485 family)|nr:DUF485 domain-containing protein [Rubrobacter sp.]